MIDGIPIEPSSVGVVGLCVIFTIALARGWIALKREVDDLKAQRDRAQDQRDEAIAIVRERTERDETILAFLRAIAGNRGGPEIGGGS